MIFLKNILRIIRIQNLLFIALIMYLIRWCVVFPLAKTHTILYYSQLQQKEQVLTFDFDLQLSGFNFFLLVFAMVCIAAAGYVINDYFDTRTDSINRPNRVVIGKHISRRFAIILHSVLNVIGCIAGVYVSIVVGHWKWGILFPLMTGILWFYSTTYKKELLIGNFIIALLAAFVPFLVVMYDVPMLTKIYAPTLENYEFNFNYLMYWVGAFSIFAFLTTLLREIIKDMEDVEGDAETGRKTLPIAIGFVYSKIVVVVIVLVIAGLLLLVNYKILPEHLIIHYNFTLPEGWYMKILPDVITRWYFNVFLFLPLAVLLYRTISAKVKTHYSQASTLTKVIMLFGILFTLCITHFFLNFRIVVM